MVIESLDSSDRTLHNSARISEGAVAFCKQTTRRHGPSDIVEKHT